MGALRKPEPLAFPSADPVEPEISTHPQPAGPVLLTRIEADAPPAGFASRSVPGARILPLRPYVVPRAAPPEPAPQPSPRVSPSFRDLLLFAAFAIMLAALLGFILGSTAARPADLRPGAAPPASQTNAVHPAKPSPYGEAFMPQRVQPRGHSVVAAAAATPAAPAPSH